MLGRLAAGVPIGELNIPPFLDPYFAAAPLVQVGYALFAFALGLAVSALTRRIVASMGVSLVVLLLTRFVLALVARPHYETPVRATSPVGHPLFENVPLHALRVNSGFLTTSGATSHSTGTCSGPEQVYAHCLRQHGIVARYVDYQPPSRIGDFQLIEFGIFTVLAILLFAATWWLIRRTRRL
jgi:ABC-type uncharacterized transport system permease subunit